MYMAHLAWRDTLTRFTSKLVVMGLKPVIHIDVVGLKYPTK